MKTWPQMSGIVPNGQQNYFKNAMVAKNGVIFVSDKYKNKKEKEEREKPWKKLQVLLSTTSN